MPRANAPDAEGGIARFRAVAGWLRYRDILMLQGPPLLGALFVLRQTAVSRVGELVVLGIANLLLVAHVFVFNDWAGAATDANDATRRDGVFAARGLSPRSVRLLWAVLLLGSLVLCGVLGWRPLALAAGIAALSAIYSRRAAPAKGIPILSSALHVVGGILHVLLGVVAFGPVDRGAVALACFGGLAFAAGHMNQEVRDVEADRANGIRTNAVAFGARRTFVAGAALFTAAYLLLVALGSSGIVPRGVAALGLLAVPHLFFAWGALREGLSFESARRFQTRYRALFALIGVVLLAALLAAPARTPDGAAKATGLAALSGARPPASGRRMSRGRRAAAGRSPG